MNNKLGRIIGKINGWLKDKIRMAKKKYMYDKKFDMLEYELTRLGCPPEKANSYDERFEGGGILSLVRENIPPEVANKYDKRFGEYDLIELYKMNTSPEVANKYDKRFDFYEIRDFRKDNISPETVNQYSSRFDNFEIDYLLKNKIPPKIANKYKRRFNGYNIEVLAREDLSCPPKIANKYDKRLGPYEICLLYAHGITPKAILSLKKKKRHGVIHGLENTLSLGLFIHKNKPMFSLINTGSTSMIILAKNSKAAFKFTDYLSSDTKKEVELLGKIKNPKNVIKVKEDSEMTKEVCHSCMEMEYISGDSLENILKKQPALPAEKVLKYSSGIMNGLIELRKAGIFYHMDVRPANVIIDKEKDRAVICDLGIATTDKHALPKDNRRYGGPNDLVSLGQIMYKMMTGNHLFAESKSMERTVYAEKLRDYRDEVYSNPSLLQKHLEQVDKTIENKIIRDLIKACLTAKNYDYGKMHKMFNKYIK